MLDAAATPSSHSDEEAVQDAAPHILHHPAKLKLLTVLSTPPPRPPDPPVTVQPPLTLRNGTLARHVKIMKEKQREVQKLQDACNLLVDKARCGREQSGRDNKVPPPEPGAPPLLTLRNDDLERFPPLPSVDPLSRDMLLPMTPNDAWKAVAALRLQLLDLQLKVMHARMLVVGGELRLQEAAKFHKRVKVTLKKELHRKEQLRRMRLSSKTSNQRCLNCYAVGKKARLAMALKESLEKVLTRMQLIVIRTGRKPKWAEEDIRCAIELRTRLGRKNYDFVRKRLRLPMPSPKVIPRGVKKFVSLKPLFDEMVAAENAMGCETVNDVDPPVQQKRQLDESMVVSSSESPAAERPVVKRKKLASKRPSVHPEPQRSHSAQPSQPSPPKQPSQPARPPQLARPSQPPRPLQLARPSQPPRPLQLARLSQPPRPLQLAQPSQRPQPSRSSQQPQPREASEEARPSPSIPAGGVPVTPGSGNSVVRAGIRPPLRPSWSQEAELLDDETLEEMTRPPDVAPRELGSRDMGILWDS